MLSSLSFASHVVSPLNTGSVVLIHRGFWCLHESHVLKQVAEVEYLNCHFRRRIVFCFRSRQRYGLLRPGSPLDDSTIETRQEPSTTGPVVYLLLMLFPQSESVKPSELSEPPRLYDNLKLGFKFSSRYPITWCSVVQCNGPSEAQNHANLNLGAVTAISQPT